MVKFGGVKQQWLKKWVKNGSRMGQNGSKMGQKRVNIGSKWVENWSKWIKTDRNRVEWIRIGKNVTKYHSYDIST